MSDRALLDTMVSAYLAAGGTNENGSAYKRVRALLGGTIYASMPQPETEADRAALAVTVPRVNVTLPTSEPVTVPVGICTICGYPGPAGTKCTNPRGCERAADPFAAFIGHARVEGARLALEAAAKKCTEMGHGRDANDLDNDATIMAERIADALRRIDPAAIVKPR